MQPNDIITFNAFLIALTQLEDSLPADIQTQLNAIGKALAANPTNLGNLDVIAEGYKHDSVAAAKATQRKKPWWKRIWLSI